jgi:hypothetical protein
VLTECHNVNSGITAKETIGISGRLHLGPVSDNPCLSGHTWGFQYWSHSDVFTEIDSVSGDDVPRRVSLLVLLRWESLAAPPLFPSCLLDCSFPCP